MSARTTVEMARSFQDRRQALSLIHSAHVRAGLPSQSENALHVISHQLLPRSRIFVAKVDSRVVSTLSLMPDSPAGLPLDSQHLQAVDSLRKLGLVIAEVGCFADRRQGRGRFVANFCGLMRCIAQYSVSQRIDALVTASDPRRGRLLKSILGFQAVVQEVSEARPQANCAASPLILEFARLKREAPEKYHAYFAEHLPASKFSGGFMPRWEADYFGRSSTVDTLAVAGYLPSAS